MKLEALKRRVARSEQLLAGRIQQSADQRVRLGEQWRQAWTPGRIIVIGLIGGFLIARARPMRALGAVSATRWVQLATSVSGLVAALQAAWAAPAQRGSASGRPAERFRAPGRGDHEGLCRRQLRRMRQLHAGAQRHLFEVQHLRLDHRVQLSI